MRVCLHSDGEKCTVEWGLSRRGARARERESSERPQIELDVTESPCCFLLTAHYSGGKIGPRFSSCAPLGPRFSEHIFLHCLCVCVVTVSWQRPLFAGRRGPRGPAWGFVNSPLAPFCSPSPPKGLPMLSIMAHSDVSVAYPVPHCSNAPPSMHKHF